MKTPTADVMQIMCFARAATRFAPRGDDLHDLFTFHRDGGRERGIKTMRMARDRFEMSDGRGYRGAPPATAERLAAALDRDQIRIAYQPKVSLTTGHLIGVEALARWTDAECGVVLPHTFIPIAERSGLIGRLTICVMQHSLETCATLRRMHPDATVAVNLSPLVLNDPMLPGEIADLLERADVAPNALVAEITESRAITEMKVVGDTLARLRRHGVGCSIDDFGTGYASLLALLRMPFTELKIDRAFVAACAQDRDAWKIVNATIRLGQELDLNVVAEGIETEIVERRLRDGGCEVGQGYRYGRPMSEAALIGAAREGNLTTLL
jgi:EAL domain-containing protein (putative c-di-GMP-specific phosphodiesterase class I)